VFHCTEPGACPATWETDGLHDDPTTLTAALSGDLDGHFETLVRAYGDRLYAFALRLTGSPPDAEEIAQDAFVRAYHALQGYEPKRIRDLALRPWLFQIALNVTRNRVRGKRPRLVSLDAANDDDDAIRSLEPHADERDGPEAVAVRLDQGAELAALVAALPGRYRAAVVLRHVEGFSYVEIGETLAQPVGTVKANVHRGIRLLREALERSELGEPALAGTRR
jgi:RNA polymerase sigma-70 factor (ECF subfamily)